MLDGAFTVDLPHGLFDDGGGCHRVVELRPLAGREELLLAGARERGSRAVSALLATLIGRLGEFDEVDASLTAALTRGDRDVLLLSVRAALYGDRIGLIVRCANPACRAPADVDVFTHELVPAATAPPRPRIELATAAGTARVREPTGADDAALEEVAGPVRERAARLWARLTELDGRPLTAADWLALPAAARHAVAVGLAEHSRAPDLVLVARCPACRALLEVELEPFALLTRELKAGGDRLLAEVHALAFHYHWSEAEILALPRPRRWRYLELLARELDGRPLIDGWS
ncbi:MAG: hypothetical protein KBG48_22955 [Kofleriaceae bacterium]|jgi:hypothetical protein|nr:hypothetical protein [Kofleriaceae bacterium]MBP9170283.1 hypothetical protein [Kofleriaceae bacterium]MBP9861527.1 hypothetical protein [Kofleriaceae bacterium]